MGGGVSQIYYNITIGGEGSTGTPNLYYVINGRPLIALVGRQHPGSHYSLKLLIGSMIVTNV